MSGHETKVKVHHDKINVYIVHNRGERERAPF